MYPETMQPWPTRSWRSPGRSASGCWCTAPPRRLPRRLDRRQQQGDQDGDDRDHHQQLDQREPTPRLTRPDRLSWSSSFNSITPKTDISGILNNVTSRRQINFFGYPKISWAAIGSTRSAASFPMSAPVGSRRVGRRGPAVGRDPVEAVRAVGADRGPLRERLDAAEAAQAGQVALAADHRERGSGRLGSSSKPNRQGAGWSQVEEADRPVVGDRAERGLVGRRSHRGRGRAGRPARPAGAGGRRPGRRPTRRPRRSSRGPSSAKPRA